MRDVLDVVFGVAGQLVYLDVLEGRPSAVTKATVYRWDQGDDDSAPELQLTPAIEASPATTTSDVCGRDEADPRAIPLTLATGVRSRRLYKLTGADARFEWVLVDAVDGTTISAKHPLLNQYEALATFESTRITATVDSTWVADLSNLDGSASVAAGAPMYRVRWEYTVGGATQVADTYFNLVRYAGRHGVVPQDVEAIAPGWLDALPTDHRFDQGRRLIDEAYDAVREDLLENELDISSIANTSAIDELVRYMAAGDPAKYEKRRDATFRIKRGVPVRGVTGAAAAAPTAGLGLSRR